MRVVDGGGRRAVRQQQLFAETAVQIPIVPGGRVIHGVRVMFGEGRTRVGLPKAVIVAMILGAAGSGCVNLDPPPQVVACRNGGGCMNGGKDAGKPSDSADATPSDEDAQPDALVPDDAVDPADVDAGRTLDPDAADAGWSGPELPVNADQRGEGGPVEAPADAQAAAPDAERDSPAGPTDSTDDLKVDSGMADADAMASGKDTKPDIGPDLNDAGRGDLPAETANPPRDVGGDAIDIPGLLAYYPCESANGAVLPDLSGHAQDASLANGSGGGSAPVGFSFGPGMVGNAITLSASNSAYISLPKGIVSQLSEVTIAAWVKPSASLAWQRIFDFGIDTNTFMYLVTTSTSGGAGVRFRIVSTPLNKNQVVDGAVPVPVGDWTHVALTLGNDGVAIFFDGVRVAYANTASLRPSDLGQTINNFIGRSEFSSDPYLNGQIDEFRMYDRVLSAAELLQLAGRQ
jgi:hypothetical protein